MEGENILGYFIELGIGIAGFSSIVVSLAKTSITEEIRLTFAQLWIQSAAIVFFSTLPMLLNLFVDSTTLVYTLCSYLYGGYLGLIITLGPISKRVKKHKILLIGFSFPVIVLTNALFFGLAWPYIGVILGGVMLAFLSFYQLIESIWLKDSKG